MLSPEEMEHVGDETAEQYAVLEIALMTVATEALLSLRTLTPEEINAGGAALMRKAKSEIEKAAPGIARAVDDDTLVVFSTNAATEALEADLFTKATVMEQAETLAKTAAQECKAAFSTANNVLWNDVNARYHIHANIAAAQVRTGLLNASEAVEKAVVSMSSTGLTMSQYTRSDGVTVKTPVDVGVRREIRTSTSQRLTAQTFEIAELTGANLVEVTTHLGARPSHARWQGRIYMLNGSSAEYPNYWEATKDVNGPHADWVNGCGGYNCYHSAHIWHEGDPRRWRPDPEAGTGFTNEEIYEMSQRQRSYENDIRHLKRQKQVLENDGLPTTEVDAKIRGRQKKLRDLIKESDGTLTREPWRETANISALKKAGLQKNLPLTKWDRSAIVRYREHIEDALRAALANDPSFLRAAEMVVHAEQVLRANEMLTHAQEVLRAQDMVRHANELLRAQDMVAHAQEVVRASEMAQHAEQVLKAQEMVERAEKAIKERELAAQAEAKAKAVADDVYKRLRKIEYDSNMASSAGDRLDAMKKAKKIMEEAEATGDESLIEGARRLYESIVENAEHSAYYSIPSEFTISHLPLELLKEYEVMTRNAQEILEFVGDTKGVELAKERLAKIVAKMGEARSKIDAARLSYETRDTLIGLKCGEAMDFERANKLRGNPGYLTGKNEYRINCQSCVVANEARRRGYMVEALPNLRGSWAEKLSRGTYKAWIDPKTGQHPTFITDDECTTPKKTLKWLRKTIEKDKRYTIEWGWKGRSNSGHIVCLEYDAKEKCLRLYDPQTGNIVYDRTETRSFWETNSGYRLTDDYVKADSKKKGYNPEDYMTHVEEKYNPLEEYMKDFRFTYGSGSSKVNTPPQLLCVSDYDFFDEAADGILRKASE